LLLLLLGLLRLWLLQLLWLLRLGQLLLPILLPLPLLNLQVLPLMCQHQALLLPVKQLRQHHRRCMRQVQAGLAAACRAGTNERAARSRRRMNILRACLPGSVRPAAVQAFLRGQQQQQPTAAAGLACGDGAGVAAQQQLAF
jgi:hypothetical protein